MMFKDYFLSFSLFLSLLLLPALSSGSHYNNGYITWSKDSTGAYQFQLVLYRVSNGVSLPGTAAINGPAGVINLTRSNALSGFLPDDLCQGLSFEKVVYLSQPISFVGSPPATGWSFSHSGCCVSSTENLLSGSGIFIQSIMYPEPTTAPGASFPLDETLFAEAVPLSYTGRSDQVALGVFRHSADFDSVRTEMTTPQQGAGQGFSFRPGYTTNSPLPSSSAPVQYDPVAAILSFASAAGDDGNYLYGVYHDFYRDGQRVARVYRNIWHTIEDEPSAAGGLTVAIRDSGQSQTHLFGSVSRQVILGDSLDLELVAFSVNPGDSLRLKIGISPLDSSLAGPQYSLPQISVQPGALSTDSLKVRFQWKPGALNWTSQRAPALFYLHFYDQQCPGASRHIVPLRISIEPPSLLLSHRSGDSLSSCAALPDTLVGLASGPLRWRPGHWVADSTAAQTTLQGGHSGWLYLEGGPQYVLRDSLYIAPFVPDSFNLALGQRSLFGAPRLAYYLALRDKNQAQEKNWTLNGLFPFRSSRDTLFSPINGFYEVEGVSQSGCPLPADTLSVSPAVLFDAGLTHYESYNTFPAVASANLAASAPRGEGGIFAFDIDPGPGSLGHCWNFEFNLFGLERTGSTVDTPEVELMLFYTGDTIPSLRTSQKVWQDDVVYFQLGNQGRNMTNSAPISVAIRLDSGLALRVLENQAYPYQIQLQGGIAQAYFSRDTTNIFSQVSTGIPLMSWGMGCMVGLDENPTPQWDIYPNPVRNELRIAHELAPVQDFWVEIVSPGGQVFQRQRMRGDASLDVSTLPAGIYFLRSDYGQAHFVKE